MSETDFCWTQKGGGATCHGFDKNGEEQTNAVCCRFDGFEGKGDRFSGMCKDIFDRASKDNQSRLKKIRNHACVTKDSFEILTKSKKGKQDPPRAPRAAPRTHRRRENHAPDNMDFCWKKSGGDNACNGFDDKGNSKQGLCCRFANNWQGKGDNKSGQCGSLFATINDKDKTRLEKYDSHMCIANDSLEFLKKNPPVVMRTPPKREHDYNWTSDCVEDIYQLEGVPPGCSEDMPCVKTKYGFNQNGKNYLIAHFSAAESNGFPLDAAIQWDNLSPKERDRKGKELDELQRQRTLHSASGQKFIDINTKYDNGSYMSRPFYDNRNKVCRTYCYGPDQNGFVAKSCSWKKGDLVNTIKFD